MQMARREKLLTNRALTIPQRINYFASVLHYFDGFQRLALYLAPSLAVATGILPIRSLTLPFVAWLVAYYATSMVAFKLTGRGYAMFIATERFHMVGFYTYIRSSAGLLTRRKLRFSVSPKAAVGGADRHLVMPALIVTAYALACFVGGVVRLAIGHDGNPAAFWINTVWSGWTVSLAVAAVLMTLGSVDYRSVSRAHAGLPVRWRVGRIEGIGVLSDLSEGGAALILPRRVRSGDRVRFDVLWPGLSFSATGMVRRAQHTESGTLVGLQWTDRRGAAAAALAQIAVDLTARRFLLDFNRPPDRVGQLDLVRGYRRRHPRRQLAVPVRLGVDDDSPWAVTEDISRDGALVLSPVALAPGTTVQLSRWDAEPVTATVMRCQPVNLPPGQAWRLGLQLGDTLVALRAPEVRMQPAAVAMAA
jgi:hypothetical protein